MNTVIIVDDEEPIRDALSLLCESKQFHTITFEHGKYLIDALKNNALHLANPSCLLLDIRMPELSGLEVFDWLKQHDYLPYLPVIFLTGHADIPTAVNTVKAGAFDFFEKPFDSERVFIQIEHALQQAKKNTIRLQQSQTIEQHYGNLSEREKEVMQLILTGDYNKTIADKLNISMRTVEVHRARIFEKMNVKSAVELAMMMNQLTQK